MFPWEIRTDAGGRTSINVGGDGQVGDPIMVLLSTLDLEDSVFAVGPFETVAGSGFDLNNNIPCDEENKQDWATKCRHGYDVWAVVGLGRR